MTPYIFYFRGLNLHWTGSMRATGVTCFLKVFKHFLSVEISRKSNLMLRIIQSTFKNKVESRNSQMSEMTLPLEKNTR